jgi:hypothetical protein
MLSHHLCFCPCPSSPIIKAAYSSALMEAADFFLNTHKFVPHCTVFLKIVPFRTSTLITSKLPPCVPGKNANEKCSVLNYGIHII